MFHEIDFEKENMLVLYVAFTITMKYIYLFLYIKNMDIYFLRLRREDRITFAILKCHFTGADEGTGHVKLDE